MAYVSISARENARPLRVQASKSRGGAFDHPAIVLVTCGEIFIALSPAEADALAALLPPAAAEARALDAPPTANALFCSTRISTFAGHDVAPDATPEWTGSLEDFRAENADAFSQAEFAGLIADLAAGREHRIGGGADAAFTVRLAGDAPDQ